MGVGTGRAGMIWFEDKEGTGLASQRSAAVRVLFEQCTAAECITTRRLGKLRFQYIKHPLQSHICLFEVESE